MNKLEKITCPFCGSTEVMKLEYGTPDEAMILKIEQGLIFHGGCAIEGMMQPYYCIQCDQRIEEEDLKTSTTKPSTI